MTQSARGGSAARRSFRHRGFRLLALALVASNLGNWIYQVAIFAYIFSTTHSTAWIAALALVRMLPGVFLGPFAGALADRSDRRRLMVASDIARGALMVVIATIVAEQWSPFGILAAVFATVIAGCVYTPATAAELPELLGEDDLAAGNATIALLYNVTMFAGPALGGVLLLVASPAVAIVVNAASFLISAALVRLALARRSYERNVALRESESLLQTAAGGVRVLLGEPLRRAVAVVTLGNYVMYGTLTVLLVALAADQFHAGGHGYGYLTAAFGAGGIAAAVVADRVAGSRRAASTVFVALTLSAVPMCLLGVTGTLLVAIVLVFTVGLGLCVVDITGITLLQRLTPSGSLGRAFGLFDALNYATTLIGILVAPMLARAIGSNGAVIAVAIAMPVVCAWTVPSLLSADRASADSMAHLRRRVHALAATEMFAPCPTMALERLAAESSLRSAAVDEVVVRQGERADDLYVVLDGSLVVTEEGERARPLRMLGAGDAFGEIGVVNGGARTATVTATAATELLRIPGEVFMECVQAAPSLADAVGGVVAQRLAHSAGAPSAAPVPAATS